MALPMGMQAVPHLAAAARAVLAVLAAAAAGRAEEALQTHMHVGQSWIAQ